jgi:uncharacterized LabA/DUF88 family protein
MKNKLMATYPAAPKLAIRSQTFGVYIDGYNLYRAINHEDPPDLLRLGWCNLQKLGELLVDLSFDLQANPRDIQVKYFTALVGKDTGSPSEIDRQTRWMAEFKAEAPKVEVVEGLHRSTSNDASNRREKMTDVNIGIHVTTDILQSKHSGMVLVSGDMDFLPLVEHAANAGIPVAVYFPQDHPLYKMRVGFEHSQLVTVSYLTREILSKCRLSDKHWIEYLQLKVRDRKKFQPCLDYEMSLRGPAKTKR